MVGVPFVLGETYDEDSGVRGTASYGGASLTLELYQGADGERIEPPRKVVIGVEEFRTCRFHRGMMTSRLRLRVRSFGALGGVPGATLDAVTLRFARRDREAAGSLGTRISQAIGPTRGRDAAALRVIP